MNTHAVRFKGRPLVMATRAAEKVYVRHARAIIQALHEIFMGEPVPKSWREDAKAARVPVGGWHQGLGRLNTAIQKVRKPAGASFDIMSASVLKKNRAAARDLLGITPRDVGMADVMATARAANLDLLFEAGRKYAAEIEDILLDAGPDARVEDLADEIEERTGVAQSHAELIARDQTLKLNAAMNETRQMAAGIDKYIWSSSKDERVRPSHQEMDGKVCRWDDPPDVNGDGEPLNPGEDFQCRCVAVPVLPEEADEEPEE